MSLHKRRGNREHQNHKFSSTSHRKDVFSQEYHQHGEFFCPHVVNMTTLGQTTRHVDDILAKNRLFDDLMMKNYDFDALCYPVFCVNSLEYVGKTSVV